MIPKMKRNNNDQKYRRRSNYDNDIQLLEDLNIHQKWIINQDRVAASAFLKKTLFELLRLRRPGSDMCPQDHEAYRWLLTGSKYDVQIEVSLDSDLDTSNGTSTRTHEVFVRTGFTAPGELQPCMFYCHYIVYKTSGVFSNSLVFESAGGLQSHKSVPGV